MTLQTLAQLDLSIVTYLADWRLISGSYASIILSEFASETAIAGFTIVGILLLARARRWHDLVGFIIAVIGSTAFSLLVKWLVARPRPPANLEAYKEFGASFPSMHAVAAVAFYGFLAWLIQRDCTPQLWRYGALALATFLIAGIGLSRVYLGVHYPSDVLAGYAIGTVFLTIGIRISRKQPGRNLC